MPILTNHKRYGSMAAKTLLLCSLVLASLGCAQRVRMMPLANQEVVALTANDVCQIMRRAGFSDDQIIQEGPGLRNALARQGAAQIRVGQSTEAIFGVHLPYIHVSSRMRGTFIYNVEKARFNR